MVSGRRWRRSGRRALYSSTLPLLLWRWEPRSHRPTERPTAVRFQKKFFALRRACSARVGAVSRDFEPYRSPNMRQRVRSVVASISCSSQCGSGVESPCTLTLGSLTLRQIHDFHRIPVGPTGFPPCPPSGSTEWVRFPLATVFIRDVLLSDLQGSFWPSSGVRPS